jgi:hypothetical protein
MDGQMKRTGPQLHIPAAQAPAEAEIVGQTFFGKRAIVLTPF